MTPTLVRHHSCADPATSVESGDRARDWAEIQERMLAPLYEAVYERLEVGTGTRLLSLGCGSGLALLIAAARGAQVTGVDTDPERLALARNLLLPDSGSGTGPAAGRPRVLEGDPPSAAPADGTPYNLITAFTPIGCSPGDGERLVDTLRSAVPLAARGSTVVLTGWGPPERCAATPVLRVAGRLGGGAPRRRGGWRPSGRDDLEEVAFRAGLNPDGSGRVACPFGYADLDSAVRGLLSTRFFDTVVRATDRERLAKVVAKALHPHRRRDGTVWLPNVFRYLVCTT
ncbi:methyltransferase domain-containing protein [Streptomyces sp. NPDC052052]|uniref:methyltransferase domain-containing protein n=1 Tax=Streptomyces sp. NPDC052052 TaxID=3154756 RepID=UPI00342478D6